MQTTTKALYENFIVYYGFPERLHSDQGRDFEIRLVKIDFEYLCIFGFSRFLSVLPVCPPALYCPLSFSSAFGVTIKESGDRIEGIIFKGKVTFRC